MKTTTFAQLWSPVQVERFAQAQIFLAAKRALPANHDNPTNVALSSAQPVIAAINGMRGCRHYVCNARRYAAGYSNCKNRFCHGATWHPAGVGFSRYRQSSSWILSRSRLTNDRATHFWSRSGHRLVGEALEQDSLLARARYCPGHATNTAPVSVALTTL